MNILTGNFIMIECIIRYDICIIKCMDNKAFLVLKLGSQLRFLIFLRHYQQSLQLIFLIFSLPIQQLFLRQLIRPQLQNDEGHSQLQFCRPQSQQRLWIFSRQLQSQVWMQLIKQPVLIFLRRSQWQLSLQQLQLQLLIFLRLLRWQYQPQFWTF